MNILLIVDDYLPHSIKVAAKMMHELAQELMTQGHVVTVLTPSSSLKRRCSLEKIDGVSVLYFRSGKIKNTNKIRRAVNESLLSFRAYWSCAEFFKSNPQDLIVAYSPSIFFGHLVARLKKLWNAQSYLILRDFFPQWAIDSELMKEGSLIHKYFQFFENKNYSVADRIGIMSPSNERYFRESEFSEKVEVLYNWVKPMEYQREDDYWRDKYNLKNKTVFFYGGNIGFAQEMKCLLDLAFELRGHPEAMFIFVGDGDEVPLLKGLVAEHKLTNVLIFPPVDQKTYLEMLNEADVGLIHLNRNHTSHNFPGKVLSYFNLNKPVLGAVNVGNDLKDVINKANAGYISDSGDLGSLKENALRLLSAKNRKQKGENGKKLLLELFDVQVTAQKITH
ncbi:glycosyltransferase family 4 protein [Persicobacter diffluens]|uniref:Glycosyltransferase WbuB n=1 Tax=Persicobacter diffluens TaxID=981 RepID=A0AAN4VWU9_9BACT|nr:glycosyltransferase WbuB [Persicobacter diffluens]